MHESFPVDGSCILDSRLWPRVGLDSGLTVNDEFFSNRAWQGYLADQLLLYDTVIIPTNDFGAIAALTNCMGYEGVIELLRERAIRFCKVPSVLFYGGNGASLGMAILKCRQPETWHWSQSAMFGDPSEAVDLYLRNCCPLLSENQRKELFVTTSNAFDLLDLDNSRFMPAVQHETFTDIVSTEGYRDWILSFYEPGATVDLMNLSDVEPNQLKFSSLEGARKLERPVDLVLRIAETNLELLMASDYAGCDLVSAIGTDSLVRQKLARSGAVLSNLETLNHLMELSRLPDIGMAVANGDLRLEQIIEVRRRRSSKEFRKWLRHVDRSSVMELQRKYCEAIADKQFVDRLPIRTLRFAVSNAVGLVWPLTGLVGSTFDSWFLPLWFRGFRPRMFFDDCRSILLQREP